MSDVSSRRHRLSAALVAIPLLVIIILARSLTNGEQPVPPATPVATVPTPLVAVVTTSPTPSLASPTVPPTLSPTATLTPAPPAATPSPTPTAVPTATPRPVPTATPTAIPTRTPASTSTPAKSGAAAPRKLVAIDAGHGGPYAGAVNGDVVEKDVNLRVALLVADLLKQAGYDVLLTRSTDTHVNTTERDTNQDGKVTVEDDLQARNDLINAAGADIVLSIHHNGSNTPMRGTMSFYCADRPQAARSKALASFLQSSLLARYREAGYASPDLGVRDDVNLGKPGGHLVMLGPATEYVIRPTTMPGALGEGLFISDPTEASLLKEPRILRAEAAAYKDAVDKYFQAHPTP